MTEGPTGKTYFKINLYLFALDSFVDAGRQGHIDVDLVVCRQSHQQTQVVGERPRLGEVVVLLLAAGARTGRRGLLGAGVHGGGGGGESRLLVHALVPLPHALSCGRRLPREKTITREPYHVTIGAGAEQVCLGDDLFDRDREKFALHAAIVHPDLALE